jgi:8-oxo-dGTP pyrophosphatase MutT (NUDIX family)
MLDGVTFLPSVFHTVGDWVAHVSPYVVAAIVAAALLLLLRMRAVAPRRAGRAQVGAVPVRVGPDGKLEVLLITTRGSARWTVPKGWPMRGLADHEAAAREAFEEAGVRGRVLPTPIGAFEYAKRRRRGRFRVTLYRLDVETQANRFRERGQRKSRWLSTQEAAERIEWPGLAAAVRELQG